MRCKFLCKLAHASLGSLILTASLSPEIVRTLKDQGVLSESSMSTPRPSLNDLPGLSALGDELGSLVPQAIKMEET